MSKDATKNTALVVLASLLAIQFLVIAWRGIPLYMDVQNLKEQRSAKVAVAIEMEAQIRSIERLASYDPNARIALTVYQDDLDRWRAFLRDMLADEGIDLAAASD